jgi:hypothetical protein
VNDLQRQFPSTVSTIFRTSDKLEKSVNGDGCDLCSCPLDIEPTEALMLDEDRAELIKRMFRCSSESDAVHVCYACRRVLRDVQMAEESVVRH